MHILNSCVIVNDMNSRFDKLDVRVIFIDGHVSCMLPVEKRDGRILKAAVLEADLMHIQADEGVRVDDNPPLELHAFWVARAIVPESARGKGAGTAIMHAFTAYMDKTQSVACLCPNAYGTSFSQEALVDWYKRNGFIEDPRYKGLFIRRPNPVKLKESFREEEY